MQFATEMLFDIFKNKYYSKRINFMNDTRQKLNLAEQKAKELFSAVEQKGINAFREI